MGIMMDEEMREREKTVNKLSIDNVLQFIIMKDEGKERKIATTTNNNK